MIGIDKRSVAINPTVFADFYVRLFHKCLATTKLFDLSWPCHNAHHGDTLRWSKNLSRPLKPAPANVPLFTKFLDRLILLEPLRCQKVLALAVLLSRRDTFRHCIDGGKIRTLKTTLGVANVERVLKSTSIQPVIARPSDWEIHSLLAEALSHVEQTCQGQRKTVYEYIKIALPHQLAPIKSTYDDITFDNLLREVCAWDAELTWLFG